MSSTCRWSRRCSKQSAQVAETGAFTTPAGTNHMDIHVDVGPSGIESLKHSSWDRLACLLRHWTWANEAMGTFDRELATGLDDEDDPMSDHPFGAFYHWCALLCGLGEARLSPGFCPPCSSNPSDRILRPVCPSSKRTDSCSSSFRRRWRSPLSL